MSDKNAWVKPGLALVGIALVVAIIVIVGQSSSQQQPAVQNAVASPAPVQMARLNRGEEKNFFDRGMAFLRGKTSKEVEDQYRRFMITNSGSGVLRMNKNQISGEIQRITEDRGAKFLEQVAGYDIAKFDPAKGRTAGAMIDENKIQKAGIVSK